MPDSKPADRPSNSDDRLRQHPAQRFAPSQHAFDLRDAAMQLMAEPAASSSGHRQQTLYRHGKVTIALFVFDQNARLATHKAAGTVTIHVIEGRMRVSASDAQHILATGNILILAPGVEHDVHALEQSTMLLQVHLE